MAERTYLIFGDYSVRRLIEKYGRRAYMMKGVV